jgi:hypothetical protein
MPTMGTRQKIACLSIERSRLSYKMGNWSDSLRKKGFGKQISKDISKEVEKVSTMLNQEVEMRLREQVGRTGKKSGGTFGKNSDLSRIMR